MAVGSAMRVCPIPTRVGVNREERSEEREATPDPHACGGEPHIQAVTAPDACRSPRVWG